MFMSATDQTVKESILHTRSTAQNCDQHDSFWHGCWLHQCPSNRPLGVTSDVESYVQESGRAGRDGQIACATIFYKASDLDSRRVSKDMIDYCRNKDCCRSLLFSHFEDAPPKGKPQGYFCCDVCTILSM